MVKIRCFSHVECIFWRRKNDLRDVAQFYVRALCAVFILYSAYRVFRYVVQGYNPLAINTTQGIWFSITGGTLTVAAAVYLFFAVKKERKIAVSLMAFLFYVVSVAFALVFAFDYVGDIASFFTLGQLFGPNLQALLPLAFPAFAVGMASTLYLYSKGALSEPSQSRLLNRIEPTWEVTGTQLVYWSLLFVWLVLLVGPLSEIFRFHLTYFAEFMDGSRTSFRLTAGLIFPFALVFTLLIRSGACVLILVLYTLHAALGEFLTLDILPDRLDWKYVIRSPLILGGSLIAAIYLMRKGILRPL